MRRRSRKRLESALRIGERQTASPCASDSVEAAAENLPVQRLAMGLAAAGQPARPDGDIGAHRRSRANSRSASSIGDDRSASVNITMSPSACRIPRARCSLCRDLPEFSSKPDFGSVAGKILSRAGRVVGRTIVDHDDLGLPPLRADAVHYRFKRRRNAGTLVVGRDDDAVLGILQPTACSSPFSMTQQRGKTLDIIPPPGSRRSISEKTTAVPGPQLADPERPIPQKFVFS